MRLSAQKEIPGDAFRISDQQYQQYFPGKEWVIQTAKTYLQACSACEKMLLFIGCLMNF